MTASLWRIVLIDPIALLVDVEDAQLLQDILTPRTIINFIRIDSVFNVDNIPVLQANIKIAQMSVTILNRITDVPASLPEILSQYRFPVLGKTNVVQEFCQINFDSINTNITLYHELHARIYNELKLSLNVCDSSYLTMIPVIETVSIGNYIELNDNDEPNVFHLSADKLSIRYGPTVGNALMTAKHVWTPIETPKPLLTRYVICNSTSIAFEFGQLSTNNSMALQPMECFCYAFSSLTAPQCLNISVESHDQTVVCPVQLNDDDKLKVLHVQPNKVLMVTTKKLSTTQKQIVVKGQIEIMNMTNESFRVQYVETDKTNETDTPNLSSIISLRANGSGSFFEAYDSSSSGHIRLQLLAENGSGWSGKVPLTQPTTIGPWLVKVPYRSEQKFITFSIRIHCEPIDVMPVNGEQPPIVEQPMRILAVIWPLFVIRSLMPMDLSIEDKEFQRNYAIKGRANCTDIQIAGTFNTEHSFILRHGFVYASNCDLKVNQKCSSTSLSLFLFLYFFWLSAYLDQVGQ